MIIFNRLIQFFVLQKICFKIKDIFLNEILRKNIIFAFLIGDLIMKFSIDLIGQLSSKLNQGGYLIQKFESFHFTVFI